MWYTLWPTYFLLRSTQALCMMKNSYFITERKLFYCCKYLAGTVTVWKHTAY